jgi:hypothetical protein
MVKFIYVLPKSIVIHIEKSESIPREYKTKIIDVKQDGTEEVITRVIPVIRYWELSYEELIAQKLYPLLPMQIFLFRNKLKKFSETKISERNQKEKQEVIQDIKNLTEKITVEIRKLKTENTISHEDAGKIVTALNKLIVYLSKLYNFDKDLNDEVSVVIKSIFEEIEEETREKVEKETQEKLEKSRVELERSRIEFERSREEMAVEMILDNMPLIKITKYSKLPEKRVRTLAVKLSRELT